MNCATPKPCGRVFFQLRVRKINTGVTSYLAFSVPRPSILRVLALALAFLLPSVGKFAQQRLRGSCRERKGQNHVSRSALCDLSKTKEALLNCVLCLFFYHCISFSLSSLSFSLSSPSLRSAFLWSSYTNSQSGDVGRPSLSLQRLAAYERALQGIVEIIITVIALVNTSEMVTQDRSVSQSLFLEGVPVPDA